jgi:hypothetical protein
MKEEKNITKKEVEKDNEKKKGWRDRKGSLKRKRSRFTWGWRRWR